MNLRSVHISWNTLWRLMGWLTSHPKKWHWHKEIHKFFSRLFWDSLQNTSAPLDPPNWRIFCQTWIGQHFLMCSRWRHFYSHASHRSSILSGLYHCREPGSGNPNSCTSAPSCYTNHLLSHSYFLSFFVHFGLWVVQHSLGLVPDPDLSAPAAKMI